MVDPDLTSWSSRDLEAYLDSGYIDSDPLLTYVEGNDRLFLWNQEVIEKFGNISYARMIKERGIIEGVTVPIPTLPRGYSAMTLLSLNGIAHDRSVALHMVRIICYSSLSRLSYLGLTSVNRKSNTEMLGRLSGKQLEILKWISSGKTNAEISVILSLPKRQVDYHTSKILSTLGVSTRIQAATIYSTR